MPEASCSFCGKPMRLTRDEALELKCDGMHFIDDGQTIVPVRTAGLKLGNPSKMIACEYGIDVEVGNFCDLYKCSIGSHTKIKHYVEIQGRVKVGQFCKIESFVFIPEGVVLGNYVFVGPGTVFTNDKYPQSVGPWEMKLTEVEDEVSIGANCTILPGIKIGKGSLIGAGSVVTKDVKAESIYVGNPARFVRPL